MADRLHWLGQVDDVAPLLADADVAVMPSLSEGLGTAALEALALGGPDAGRRRALRLLLGTGFLGGFTTYSALAVDSVLLAGSGRAAEGVAYLAVSVLIGLVATAAGVALATRLRRRPRSGRGTPSGAQS